MKLGLFVFPTALEDSHLLTPRGSIRYCKVPPRALFICQVYGTALGSIVNYSRTFHLSFLQHLSLFADALVLAVIRGVINSKRPYLDGTLMCAEPPLQMSGCTLLMFSLLQ